VLLREGSDLGRRIRDCNESESTNLLLLHRCSTGSRCLRTSDPPHNIFVAIVIRNPGSGHGAFDTGSAATSCIGSSGRETSTPRDAIDVAIVVYNASTARTFDFQLCLIRVVVIQVNGAFEFVFVRVIVDHLLLMQGQMGIYSSGTILRTSLSPAVSPSAVNVRCSVVLSC